MSRKHNLKDKVVIIGAGLVGSLLSIYLSKHGYEVEVFDKRSAPSTTSEEGRSINLAVSERAWNALRPLGLEQAIKDLGIPMYGRQIHHIGSNSQFQEYTSDDQAIYSTSRLILNQRLIKEADKYANTTFHFNSECSNINTNSAIINGQKVEFNFLFGADGANSVVRKFINDSSTKVLMLDHEYAELHINPINGRWALDNNALHIWPRGAFMLIALPNPDGSFTCTLFAPKTGENSFQEIASVEDLKLLCKNHFPDVANLLIYPKNITPSKLGTLKTNQWYKDNVCLIGDAAHAIVPFYGQGMNAGFEDCAILDKIIKKVGNFDFELFQNNRKENTNAIADLALQNFVEMRDLVANQDFLLLKKLDNKLHSYFPEIWIPTYDQVSFTNTPYKEAFLDKKNKESVLNRINDSIDWEKKWSTPAILQVLTKYYLNNKSQ